MDFEGPDKEGLQMQSTPSTTSTASLPEGLSAGDKDRLDTTGQATAQRLSPTPSQPPLSRHVTTNGSVGAPDPAFEVDWDGPDDQSNPKNWPIWYRGLLITVMSFATWVVVLYSTAYTSGVPELMREFHVSSETIATLGISTYLLGLAVGCVILAPLSEMYGRKIVYVFSMAAFALLVLPCALASSLEEILVVRFIGAFAGVVMIANSPGTVSDIVDDEHRALAFSIWSVGPFNGPIFGPLIGGFATEYLGWRWTNWLVFIFGGVAWIMVCLIKETYGPAILQKKAKMKRKETGDPRWWSRYDNELNISSLLKVNLARPIFWDLYIGVVYGILYLCFVAYPIVFAQIRQWSPGITGLSFVGIGVGTFMAIFAEPLIRRMINRHRKDPETGRVPPEAMVSIICIGAICAPVGELWFAWTCVPVSTHWVWPILAGIPFGAGNTVCFIYVNSYLTQSYGIYAASALAGNTVVRSLFGATLPLAGPTMYRVLNPHWAGTFLGLLEVILIPIPFVFYKYGHRIRMKSTLINKMQKDKDRLDGRKMREMARRDLTTAAV
ncbi:MAG: hypothetical protein M1835_005274 [Candelina submexicana]|nr:MAG: hypothetical protein M1835_005274 [Candelina submexicana]